MKTVAWIVLAVSLACTAMFVMTGLTDDTELPWLNGWMAGPVILLFVVPTLFRVGGMLGGGTAKAYRDAPIGMGTVVSVSRTGLSINDQPQLEIVLDVDTPDGQSFRGVARQIVDLTELAMVAPGAVLPVRYLAGGPERKVVLAVGASQQEMQAALNRVQLAKGTMTQKQLMIAEQGIDTQAVVLAMVPTGEIRGDRAVAHLTMRVTRPDGSTFDLTQEKALAASTVPQVQPGAVVRAKYLPHDESEVVVVTALAR
ncbi:hypothetical protein [Allokutzneria oryzae]|uniref:Uncharacterized protein n=1 Tax=Allokutzneria oryzae TaxID=1378989 RepID=A0ABV6A9A2_9PSEU